MHVQQRTPYILTLSVLQTLSFLPICLLIGHSGHIDSVEMLIKYNANPSLISKYGTTARQCTSNPAISLVLERAERMAANPVEAAAERAREEARKKAAAQAQLTRQQSNSAVVAAPMSQPRGAEAALPYGVASTLRGNLPQLPDTWTMKMSRAENNDDDYSYAPTGTGTTTGSSGNVNSDTLRGMLERNRADSASQALSPRAAAPATTAPYVELQLNSLFFSHIILLTCRFASEQADSMVIFHPCLMRTF